MTAPTVLTERLTMNVLGSDGIRSTVRVDLSWSAVAHPEVLLVIHAGRGQTIEWVMARELLADGLICKSGEGDVRIAPDPAGGFLQIVLRSEHDAAVFTADLLDVADFLGRTTDIEPLNAPVHVPEPDWPGWIPLGGVS